MIAESKRNNGEAPNNIRSVAGGRGRGRLAAYQPLGTLHTRGQVHVMVLLITPCTGTRTELKLPPS